MKILKELEELVENHVISKEIANSIENYYSAKKTSPQKRLFIVFGILGAVLVGLGINLIIAHNWDNFSRPVKTFFAFLPLILGQLISVYVILKKYGSTAWRESASSFLFFAVGASISLVSQIYNIPGDLAGFLLTWMLLTLPLIYVMKSSVTSLLFISGITYYACEVSYWTYPEGHPWLYWPLLLAVLPHYYLLYKNNHKSNFITFHNWFFTLSLIISLGSVATEYGQLMYIAYLSLFGLFYLIGNFSHLKTIKLLNNAFLITGALGTAILSLTLSFDWYWERLVETDNYSLEIFAAPEFIVAFLLSVIAIVLLIRKLLNTDLYDFDPLDWAFLGFIIAFFVGLKTEFAYWLINVEVLAIGLLIIRKGAKLDHFGVLNFGLLIVMALTACRFFDSNISFVIRGILFVGVGVGFFVANYLMLKKRRENEN